MTVMVLLGPDKDYLKALKEADYAEVIDLVPVIDYLNDLKDQADLLDDPEQAQDPAAEDAEDPEETLEEEADPEESEEEESVPDALDEDGDGDLVELSSRLIESGVISGFALIAQYPSMDAFVEDVGHDYDSIVKRFETNVDEDQKVRIIGIGADSYVPVLGHSFTSKRLLEHRTFVKGAAELPTANGKTKLVSSGSLRELDFQRLEAMDNVLLLHTVDAADLDIGDSKSAKKNDPVRVYTVYVEEIRSDNTAPVF